MADILQLTSSYKQLLECASHRLEERPHVLTPWQRILCERSETRWELYTWQAHWERIIWKGLPGKA